MEAFEQIIQELGLLFGEEFHSYQNQVCTIEIDETVKVQIELHPLGDFLQVSAFVSELPPGKFREEILKNGLKANSLVGKNSSILAYTSKSNQLVLFQNIPTEGVTGDKLYERLTPFVKRVKAWKEAIDAGRPYPSTGEIPPSDDKNKPRLFGF